MAHVTMAIELERQRVQLKGAPCGWQSGSAVCIQKAVGPLLCECVAQSAILGWLAHAKPDSRFTTQRLLKGQQCLEHWEHGSPPSLQADNCSRRCAAMLRCCGLVLLAIPKHVQQHIDTVTIRLVV